MAKRTLKHGKHGKRGSRKMGGRRGKKGSRKTHRRMRGGYFGSTVINALSSKTSRGIKNGLVPQPQSLPWTGSFSANRYALKGAVMGLTLPQKIFVYEMKYNGPAKTLVITFEKVGIAQLEMKSGIKTVLENIGCTLPEGQSYFAVGKGGITGNAYWSKTNVVTFNFSEKGINSINITSNKEGQIINKTIDANDSAVTNKNAFENGFDSMKLIYDKYLKSGELEVTEMTAGPEVNPNVASDSYNTLRRLAPADSNQM
jgi:hypothetical protein